MHTICQDRLNLELVPLPKLNNRSSCEGGKHGYGAPASTKFVPELDRSIIGAVEPFHGGIVLVSRVLRSSAHAAVMLELSGFGGRE